MPENIFKLYRPSGRGKKGSGLWHNEPELDRFNHIKNELSRYWDKNNDYDYYDLVWHIKNAVVGDIFFSEEVYKRVLDKSRPDALWKNVKPKTEKYNIIEGIMKRTTLQPNWEFDETFLEIRKWLGNKDSGGSLRFEHVIPAKRYIDELIIAYRNNRFDVGFFRDFRKKICVCIVTEDEDKRLNDNGMKKDMPKGWTFSQDRFDRYNSSLIQIHGKDKEPQPHEYSFKESNMTFLTF